MRERNRLASQVEAVRALERGLAEALDYAELARQLPAGVEPAYDGMALEIAIDEEVY